MTHPLCLMLASGFVACIYLKNYCFRSPLNSPQEVSRWRSRNPRMPIEHHPREIKLRTASIAVYVIAAYLALIALFGNFEAS